MMADGECTWYVRVLQMCKFAVFRLADRSVVYVSGGAGE